MLKGWGEVGGPPSAPIPYEAPQKAPRSAEVKRVDGPAKLFVDGSCTMLDARDCVPR